MVTLDDFADLTAAEIGLIDHLRRGEPGVFFASPSLPPANASHGLQIRASLIRALILRQVTNVPLPERGLRIQGAYIHGDGPLQAETPGLDLEGATLQGDLALIACQIPDKVVLRSADVGNLILNRSRFDASLSADRLLARGDVFLRGITSAGEIRFLRAQLGGDLDCEGAWLKSTGYALSADRLSARGSIFLSGISAVGEIRLAGAQVGGNLDCEGAKLNGKGCSLTCEGAKIGGVWYWRIGACGLGVIDMTAAEIGSICDEPGCWPPEILLDRCRYGAFIGKGVDGAQRIDWLSRQKPQKYGDEFWPQPYEECARALREAGHGADARIVLIEKERLQREARRRRLQAELEDWRKKRKVAGIVSGVRPFTDRVIGTWLRLQTARVWDALLGEAVAYGRRPGKAAVWLAAFLLLGWLIFARAAGFGEIKPNLPQIQRAPEWVACGQAEGAAIAGLPAEAASGRARAGETQLACFLRQPEALAYPRFAPLIYSADTLLPIVSLEMQSYWIPDDSKPIGAVARFYLWVHIFAGWGLTLLAVAGFSGLIKTDNTR